MGSETTQPSDPIEEMLMGIPYEDPFKPLWRLRFQKECEINVLHQKPGAELEAEIRASSQKTEIELAEILAKSGVNRLFQNGLLNPGGYGGLPFSHYRYEASEASVKLWLITKKSKVDIYKYGLFGRNQLAVSQDFYRPSLAEEETRRRILFIEPDYRYPVGALGPHIGPRITIIDQDKEGALQYFTNETAIPRLEGFIGGIRRELTPQREVYPYKE